MAKKQRRRIGILTGGGDCPGLNAVLRAFVKTLLCRGGFEVLGIEDGYEGLLEKRARLLWIGDVRGILTQGGTILGTSNTANPFKVAISKAGKRAFEDRSDDALRHVREWGLEGLVTVGGDGTLHSAHRLSQKGILILGIPKTIDNDIWGTDYTFGFNSAVAIATDAVDRLHTTAASHHRVMVLEVMGRNAGWIALHAGSAGGADIILIPEIPFRMDWVCEEVRNRAGKGMRFSIIVAAEGAFPIGGTAHILKRDPRNPFPVKLGGIGQRLAETIERKAGIESRAAVLGHIQRGGSPTPFDRNLGTLFGVHAAELVVRNKWDRMVSLRGQNIGSIPIRQALKPKRVERNNALVRGARAIGVSFGDKPCRAR